MAPLAPAGSLQPGVLEVAAREQAAPDAEPAAPVRKIDIKDLDAIRALVSDSFSEWSPELQVTQELIDRFATLSRDDYRIHTDPERCHRESPFGTTIAQGMLVQALVGRLRIPLTFEMNGYNNMVNYGSDSVRFPAPVISGCCIRARSRVKSVEAVKSGVKLTMEINVHVAGQDDRPCAINDMVIMYL